MKSTSFGKLTNPPTVCKTNAPLNREDYNAANVIVKGVPYSTDMNIVSNKDDRHKLTEGNVYWIRDASGKTVACLKSAKTNKLKKISLAACHAIWPNATEEDCGISIIVKPGLTRPYLPENYIKAIRRSLKNNSATKKPLFNIDIKPNAELLQQSFSTFTTGFFASDDKPNTTSPKVDDSRSRLIALLQELRLQSKRCLQIYSSIVENSSNELAQLRTLDDVRTYPYSRFLLQFFDFFFPPEDTTRRRKSTDEENNDVVMA